MPVLMLLRHAKSSWQDASLADFDRPLARRGIAAAPLMGREMMRRGWLPDLVLVSPARRTRETWNLVARQWPDGARPVVMHDDIYEADAERLLDVVRKESRSADRVLLIGHNPAMEDLAALLAGHACDPDALSLMTAKFPTCALARLTFDGDWPSLGADAARLDDFLRPRDLDANP